MFDVVSLSTTSETDVIEGEARELEDVMAPLKTLRATFQ